MKDVIERIQGIASFEELEKAFPLEQIKKALVMQERNRLYHKAQYLKKQAIMERVKREHPELFED